MAVAFDSKCISPTFVAKWFRHRIFPVFRCPPTKSTRGDCLGRQVYSWWRQTLNRFKIFTRKELEVLSSDWWNIYLGELILWHGTSRLCPNNSWLRSTIPHGAIPMLTTRPDLCCPSTSSASPTCFVTPDVRHGERRLKN